MHTPPADSPLELAPMAPTDAPFEADASAKAPSSAIRAECANCGVQLLGPHCYACGQPVKGMVRHLSSILADASDTILNIDSRIFRTLWPLLLRPGFLTTEYFAGRRVRYVTPFRLYFFLSVAAFFLMQLAIGDLSDLKIQTSAMEKIASAMSVDEVTAERDEAIHELQENIPVVAGTGKAKIDAKIESIRKRANLRVEYLHKVTDAKLKGEAIPADPSEDEKNFRIGNFDIKHWDAKANPVRIGWLPQFGNDKVNQLLVHARDNALKISSDGDLKPFVVGTLSVLPQVLFVLMPLFALMLKIFYIFKRRLYMEHLIVALHSHAFIFLALLLLTLASMAKSWATSSAPWLSSPLNSIIVVLGWWLPIYLFLMQKKVYKQGWIMTSIKYSLIGISYSFLILFGAIFALLVSFAIT